MNPGKIIDCPPMRENLRYGPDYQADSLLPTLDFSLDTNYAGAVEMCNGMGRMPQADRHHVPLLHGNPRRGALNPGPGQPAAGPPCPASCPKEPLRTSACTKRWTSAWSARPVSPNASPAWTWPSLSTSSWTITTRPTSGPSATSSLPTSPGTAARAASSRPWPTWAPPAP